MLEATGRRLQRVEEALEELVTQYNRRRYVHPDPLEFLYDYPDVADREIVGLVASSLAYGRVSQILTSVSRVLAFLGPSPSAFLRRVTPGRLASQTADFKHRFTTGAELSALLCAIKRIRARQGSLCACFARHFHRGAPTVLPALDAFAAALTGGRKTSLIPRPSAGSACKRLNLYLRWMVRCDAVDPGGWSRIPASALIVPLDTHMFRLARGLGLTKRKQADMRAALEVTAAFSVLAPHDPIRYDFALTRLGIRPDGDIDAFLRRVGGCVT